MGETILIVEDDPDIVEILTLYLTGAGFDVAAEKNGRAGLEALRACTPSVVLVDLMMPEMNGFEFIKGARAISDVPIIVVSARSQTSDRVLGLDLGADGYIAKPFDPTEVIAYVRAMLRRSSGALEQTGATLRAGGLELDTEQIVARKDGEAVPLTASEYKILLQLMSSPGRVFTKDQLYAFICGEPAGADGTRVGSDSVMVHISNIRAKVEDDPSNPQVIETVRGLGYRLVR